jgi:hypothetical protein
MKKKSNGLGIELNREADTQRNGQDSFIIQELDEDTQWTSY